MGLVRNKVSSQFMLMLQMMHTFALTDYCAGTANWATAIVTSGGIILI